MPSESKIESSHFMSPMEDSRRLETFRKSAMVVMENTWRRNPLWRLLRAKFRARSRFFETSATIRRMGRSYSGGGVVVTSRTVVRSMPERLSTWLARSTHSCLEETASWASFRILSANRIGSVSSWRMSPSSPVGEAAAAITAQERNQVTSCYSLSSPLFQSQSRGPCETFATFFLFLVRFLTN